ncbi:MAG TPA: 3-oxoacyl-[acyl-carrier-protein] synthase III C-terminal domain-containing protein [Methylomirabilota bacterium]|nr:3-oxoacyl-[acyl-carrier-protein] synthase III C-terminal domain-containing protein [Methylomirabilota bacterium]
MIGVVTCGYHVPFHRLEREKIGQAWARRAGKGERAAIYFDEDALTLGLEAAQRCLEEKGKGGIDGLYFASTSAPFWQRSSASFIAAACDLPAECETVDFAGSLRSATSALRTGVDALQSGRLSRVLITAGEVRNGQPNEGEEEWFGDAGSAVMLGRDGVVAEIVALASRSDDFLDEWRRDTDSFVQTQASRFTTERGYQASLVAVGKALVQKSGLQAQDFAKIILPSPDGRAHVNAAKRLGFQDAQIQNPLFQEVGACGSAAPFLLLAAALEKAKPGDRLLLLAYGEGADGFVLRVTEEITRRALSRSLSDHLSEKRLYPSYTIFRKMREYYAENEEGPELSNVFLAKEEKQNVRLYGTQCLRCGTRQYPIARVCIACQNHDSLQEVPLERTGSVFTFTRDHLYVAPDSPTIMSVVDLQQGGRLYIQMTDVDPEDVRVGDEVVLTLRRRKEGPTMHHYYWKCRPVR